jgi:PEGA domain
VGHVGEFNGVGKALLVAPGKHRIKISLPGYQTFETEISLTANQKFQLKTDLIKAPLTQSSIP